MNDNINWDIELIRQKKREIVTIEEKIDAQRKTFEEVVKPLIDTFDRVKNELSLLSEIIISIRLGDLLDELAWLSGIKVSDIYVEIETGISFYGRYTLNEILELMSSTSVKNCRSNNSEMQLDLFGCDEDYSETCKPVFEYYALLILNLEEVQADGTKLIEHCDIKYGYDDRGVYTKMIVNSDIENIICNFNLGYIDKVNDENWYPTDLFTQAIINCVERNYNSKNDRIRERIKDNK